MNINNKSIHKKYQIFIPVFVNSACYFFLPKFFYYAFCIITLIYLISVFFEKSYKPNLKYPLVDYILSIIFLSLIFLTKINFKLLFVPFLELLVIRILSYNLKHNVINKNKDKENIFKNDANTTAIQELKEEIAEVKTIICNNKIDSKNDNLNNDIHLLKGQMQQILIGLNITTDIKKQLDETNKVVKEIYSLDEKINKLDESIKQKNVNTELVSEINELKNKLNDNIIVKEILKKCEFEKLDFSNSRYLKNYEIREKFIEALKTTKIELDIISPWISEWVFEHDFINLLKNALKRGSTIKIIYGIGDGTDCRGQRSINNAEKLKQILNDYHENFKIIKGNTHNKLILCDNNFFVQGSFNFLSFKGTYDGTDVRDEGAIYSENESIIKDFRRQHFNF